MVSERGSDLFGECNRVSSTKSSEWKKVVFVYFCATEHFACNAARKRPLPDLEPSTLNVVPEERRKVLLATMVRNQMESKKKSTHSSLIHSRQERHDGSGGVTGHFRRSASATVAKRRGPFGNAHWLEGLVCTPLLWLRWRMTVGASNGALGRRRLWR